MAKQKTWAALIRQLSTKYGVDPSAALAVASVEGLSGAVGDGGHAFGPFQMNDAGGVLTGRFGSSAERRRYAESSQGIEEAIRAMAKVAKGLKGQDAIEAIVRKYERPADPSGEIQRALGHYGKVTATGPNVKGAQVGGGPAPAGGGGTDPNEMMRRLLIGNLMSQTSAFANGQESTPNPGLMLQQMQLLRQMAGAQETTTQESPRQPQGGRSAAPFKGSIGIQGNTGHLDGDFMAQLQEAVKAAGGDGLKITSGYRDPSHNAAVGGVSRSNHLTGNAIDGYAHIGGQWIPLGTALKGLAAKYGLRSGDVAGFYNGRPDPVHVDSGANQR